jgi:hypothetical protein
VGGVDAVVVAGAEVATLSVVVPSVEVEVDDREPTSLPWEVEHAISNVPAERPAANWHSMLLVVGRSVRMR